MTDDTGKIGWIDMTVENAAEMRDFYASVVGLKPEDVSMGDYSDYNMTMPAENSALSGIRMARPPRCTSPET